MLAKVPKIPPKNPKCMVVGEGMAGLVVGEGIFPGVGDGQVEVARWGSAR
jgi:hypothetical protein